MQTFSYKATDVTGKVINGSLEAPETRDAVARVQEMGYIPIKVQPVNGKGWLNVDLSKQLSLFQGVSTKDVATFTQDLSSLLGAGLPVDRALVLLRDVTNNEKFKTVIDDILKTVRGGSYLSDALAKHPLVFSTFYVNMVRAGEAGSVLETVLDRLSIFLESAQELRDYIRSSMVYPLFLVFVGGISIIILLTFVVPKFSLIFADMGQAVPVTARFLLGLSDVLKHYWAVILGVLGTGGYLVIRYIRTPAGRMKLDRYTLKLPVSGDFVKKVEVARFARTLGTPYPKWRSHPSVFETGYGYCR